MVGPTELKKSLSFWQVTLYGVGIILGAGIYALIGEAAGIAGNALWLSFVVSAVIAGFTALSYAELSSSFPKAAAEFIYAKRAFKNNLLAFVVGWFTILTGIIAVSVVSLGFGGYLRELFGIPLLVGAIGLIAFFSFVNFWGIKESAGFNVVFTLIEVIGLILVIIVALPFFGSVNYLEVPGQATGLFEFFSPLFIATALVFFAFIGFEDMANISEETKEAKKTIPKALLTALFFSTIIYILVSIAAVSVVPFTELAASSAPLSLVMERAAGFGWVLSIIALFATANTVLIMLIVSSRMLYGMAREGSIPSILSRVHSTRRTPWIAILLTLVFSVLFLLVESIGDIAFLSDFGIFLMFLVVNLSLIAIRFSKDKPEAAFRVPLNIGRFPLTAGLGAVFCFFMLFHFTGPMTLFGLTLPIWLFGAIVFGLGLPVGLVISRTRN